MRHAASAGHRGWRAESAARSRRGSRPTARACWRSTSARPATAPASPFEADLTTREGNRAAVDAALERLGGLDCVVANAGMQHVAPVEDFPEDDWDRLIALLLTSPFLLAKYAWPALRDAGDARFIAIASAHALVASPFKSAYVSAKHGVLGAGQDARARGRRRRHPGQRRLPRLRAHAAGGGPGRRPGQGQRRARGARARGRDPRPARRQAPDRAGRGRRGGAPSWPAPAGAPSAAPRCRWTWAGPPAKPA